MATVSNCVSVLAGKFRGCLVGSLMGDCLGAPFENDFPVPKTVLTNYFMTLLNSSSNKGTSQIHPYTDDTAMTWSVARSLIENKCINPEDLAKRFTNEYFNQPKRGYGAMVRDVFKALKSSNFADPFQPAKDQFNGLGSYGNGAAMRVSPVALYSSDIDLMLKMTMDCSQITHSHKDGYNGAILQCFAVYQALLSDSSSQIDPKDFLDKLIDKMEPVEKAIKSDSEDQMPFCSKLKTVKEIFEKGHTDMSAEEVGVLLGHYVTALKSVPIAIYSFLLCQNPIEAFQIENPFVRTLYFAISLGGDTDTIASMAGSIAGAFYGISCIPENLQKHCEGLEISLQLADELYQISKN